VIRLLAYVEEFNAGGVCLPSDPNDYHSNVEAWPHEECGDTEGAFGFALLGNVNAALKSM
jgi:hypothetical protein